MSESPQAVGLAASLGLSTTLSLFFALTPKLSEVRRGDSGNTEFVADLRHGEIVAASLGLTSATAASLMADSVLPLLVSAVVLTALIAIYEYTLTHRPLSPPKGTHP